MRFTFRSIIIRFLAIFTLLLPLTSLANPQIKEVTASTKDGVVLKGLRYANPGGPPVILSHGILNNTRVFKEMAEQLYLQGYDVYMYNFRGHGGGDLMSMAPKHLVEFDRIAAFDTDAIIKSVAELSGKRPTFLGYSMGGMALSSWLAGVDMGVDGIPFINQELARTRNAMIKRAIFLAAPPNLAEIKGAIAGISGSKGVGSLVAKVKGPNIWTTSINPLLQKLKQKGPTQRKAVKFFEQLLGSAIVKDRGFTSTLHSGLVNPIRMAKFLTKGISEDRTGGLVNLLEGDFLRWRTEEDPAKGIKKGDITSKRGGINYSKLHGSITCDVVVIAGDLDTMAPGDVVYRDFYRQLGSKEKVFIRYKDANHLDVLIAEGSETKVVNDLMAVDDMIEAGQFYTETHLQAPPGTCSPGQFRKMLRSVFK